MDLRYNLESEIYTRTKYGNLSKEYYESIASAIWQESIYNAIKNFVRYMESLSPKPKIVTITMEDIDVAALLAKHAKFIDIKN